MDKNTITGFVLIAILLFGYMWWAQPSAEQMAEQARQDSIAMVEAQKAEKIKKQQAEKLAAAKVAATTDSTALFHSALNGTPQNVVLKNNKLELTLSTKGATVQKAVIKNFKNIDDKQDVTLFDGKDQSLNYTFALKETNISTQDLYFTPSETTDSTVVMTAQAAPGKEIKLSYVLGKDYMLHMQMSVVGMAGMFAPNNKTVLIDWQDKCRQQEKGFTFENRYATLTYHKTEGGTDYLNETKEKIDEVVEDQTDWVAFKNQFFSAVIIAKNNFNANGKYTSVPYKKGEKYLKQYEAKLESTIDTNGIPAEFDFYYGPNDFRLLQSVEKECNFGKDLQMERLVYLGWPLFRIINRWFTIYVFDALTSMAIPMGIVLILITLLLKIITYPMVKKSYMSSAKMRVLKPKLEEATKQFNGEDQQMQKQQAMMSEYQKYGVSPMAGCLPMLIQMPIWIAMFNFVPNAIQLRGQSFLWIKDLSTYDPIIEWGKNIWLIGDHLSLTCILFCVGNLAYSWMSMKQQKDQMVGQQADQMKMMQWMMLLMPVMFFFIFNDYSAGLNFYYFISLFFSAAIMWGLRHFTDDEKLLAKLEARYKENKDKPQKLSGLAARMQAMQQEQERLQKQREELERKKKGLNK